jgi:hypothetical protein
MQTAILISSLLRRNPQALRGKAFSQLPLWLAVAASMRATSHALLALALRLDLAHAIAAASHVL